MSNAVKFNPKRDLPYLAAIAQTAQFALAGSVLLGDKGWLFGGLLGLLVSVSVAYASSQYADIAKQRKPWSMAGMILLGLLSPVIVGTSMYLDLSPSIDPIWRGVVGACWGILPDASVALVGFVAGRGMVKAEEQPPATATTAATTKKATKKKLPGKIDPVVLVDNVNRNPKITNAELAQLFGVSPQAVQKHRAARTGGGSEV